MSPAMNPLYRSVYLFEGTAAYTESSKIELDLRFVARVWSILVRLSFRISICRAVLVKPQSVILCTDTLEPRAIFEARMIMT